MRANNRRHDPGSRRLEVILAAVGFALIISVLVMFNVALRVGYAIDGTELPAGNPVTLPLLWFLGDVAWPRYGTVLFCATAAVMVALLVGGLAAYRRIRRGTRVDRVGKFMGRGKDVESLTRRNAEQTASRLKVDGSPGVPIGRSLSGHQTLYGSWEDMHIDIWGPRTGKTTSRAIPAIIDAPGAVLVTSNKRDVVDASRDVRARTAPVWVFDPQNIAAEEPSWWWNPLSYVTDEVKAAKMAGHFASGSREPGARTDAFFDPAGQDLLAGLLLAAALDGRSITDVYTWVTRPTDETPVDILREHGFVLIADQVSGVVTAPERQRGGIYGTAQQMASCLTNRSVLRWITPSGDDDHRPQFDPDQFVRSGGTLYSLSKEGRGTAGPLVTALTVAVIEAAEAQAVDSPGGRLRVPMLGVLDEAANVCRWKELPDLYSHYGSRGIVLMTILQSWSQGVEVWGESGMKKLWSASNIKVYGGGVSEAQFLEDLSRLIGDYDRVSRSKSYNMEGQRSRTVNKQLSRERILDVADLASMPKGRALVLSSGNRPTLIKTQPWMAGPHAAAVRASIDAHDPQSARTLREAEPAAQPGLISS